MKKIRILSLFDGISCGYLALQRAGIEINEYFAYEIDKYALKVSAIRFPKIQQFGDVTKANFKQHGEIDLLIGGSPCQDLSVAKQNREGLSGKRSGLFWEYVRALKETNPKYFLLENVASMSKADKAVITETLGVEPIMINSALVSAQSRKRLYWTNIPGVTQPEDKGLKLADVLENGMPCNEKSNCILATYSKTSLNDDIAKSGRTIVAVPTKGCALRTWPRNSKENRIYNHLEVRKDEKSNNLTSCTKGFMVCGPLKIGNIGNKGSRENRIYSIRGKSISLCANGGGLGAKTGLYKIDLPDGDYTVRKLTPTECERLQTLPDGYTDVEISNTQRYKCLGNAWTVDVIAHIFSFLQRI